MYSVAKGALYGFDRVVPYTWLEIAGSVVAVVATIVVVAVRFPRLPGPAHGSATRCSCSARRAGSLRRRRPHGGAGSRLGRGRSPRDGRSTTAGTTSAWPASVVSPAPACCSCCLLLAGWFTSAGGGRLLRGRASPSSRRCYFLPRALGMALFPAMARAHGAGDVDAVRRHADISTRALLVLLAPLFAAAHPSSPGRCWCSSAGPTFAPTARPCCRCCWSPTYVAVIQVAAVNSCPADDGGAHPRLLGGRRGSWRVSWC